MHTYIVQIAVVTIAMIDKHLCVVMTVQSTVRSTCENSTELAELSMSYV